MLINILKDENIANLCFIIYYKNSKDLCINIQHSPTIFIKYLHEAFHKQVSLCRQVMPPRCFLNHYLR